MKGSKLLVLATSLCAFATANAQRSDSSHRHYDEPKVINGMVDSERLSPGVRLQYVLTTRSADLKNELSEDDYAIVSNGAEILRAAEERRKAKEVEDFDFICRNLSSLDVETILQIAEKPHIDRMNLPESAVRKHISGLSNHGKKTLRDMLATTDYRILIVQPDNSEYARKHPDYFRASVSDKCASYLSSVDATDG